MKATFGLDAYEELKAKGVPDEQAKAQARLMVLAAEPEVDIKKEINNFKDQMHDFSNEMQTFRNEMSNEMHTFRNEIIKIDVQYKLLFTIGVAIFVTMVAGVAKLYFGT